MSRYGKRIWHALLLIVTLIVCAWVLLSGWGGYVNPQRWALPSVAVLTYPAAIIVAMVLLLVALITRGWKASIMLAVSLLLTLPALRVNMPLSGGHAPADSTATFKLLTYNVTGFWSMHGHEDVSLSMRYILDSDADLVVLQEASLEPHDFTDKENVRPMKSEIERKYPYRSSYGYHDLIILSRYPYEVNDDISLRNYFGTGETKNPKYYHVYAKAFDVSMPEGRQLRIVNVHMQSIGLNHSDKQVYRNITHLDSVRSREQMHQARNSLYTKLARAFRRRAGEAHQIRKVIDTCPENVIVCGDFNDTPASYTYWTVRGDDLADAYAQCGRGLTYTFNKDLMLFNIDHIFYRGNLDAVNIKRVKAGTSDHYPLLATFEWQDKKN